MENGIETFRSLSQLEVEMRKSENEYIKADSRYNDAEAAFKDAETRFLNAQRDRDVALRALNECHSDLDRTIEMLREASPLGCEWKNQADRQAALPHQSNGRRDAVVADFMLKD